MGSGVFLGWNFRGEILTTAGFFEAKFACVFFVKKMLMEEKSHTFFMRMCIAKVEFPDQLLPQLAQEAQSCTFSCLVASMAHDFLLQLVCTFNHSHTP